MPGFDGTGPRGEGPMTGGRRGNCVQPLPANAPTEASAVSPAAPPQYGRGLGRRRGCAWRGGRGRSGGRGRGAW